MDTILSARLKESREKMFLKRKETARVLGISWLELVRYENGERIPSIDTLRDFVTLYQVSADYLLGFSDNQDFDLSYAEAYKKGERAAFAHIAAVAKDLGGR